MTSSFERANSVTTLGREGFSWRLLPRALVVLAMLPFSIQAMADAPIWANAKRVKATLATCGEQRSLLFTADSFKSPAPPSPAGCKSEELIFAQLNIFKAYFRAKDGSFAEANVDAGYISCGSEAATGGQRGILIVGTDGAIKRAIREHPAPAGCTFTRQKYQYIAGAGGIPFTDVPNGGTMSVRESLAIHAKEREQAIAECNASPACQAEVRRRSAINSYFDCMKPLQANEPARTCYRPW